ncbi:MAG: hypothetical protein Q7S77_00270, partial [Candidatus Staskawiczbacteria bacterium]|nr:hypothetical protein [Candidatus Staskawiczbacteria bacterium]
MAENTPEQPVPQSGDKPKEDIRKARIISVEVKDSTDEEKENMKKTEEVLQRKIKKESQKPKIDLPEETPESKDIKKARIISPEQQTALRPESKKNNIELKGPLSNAIKEAAEEILGKKLPKDAQEKPIASKPEQQQSSESENNPADDGLDIDAAREFLNKAYGPEESSVAVGAENTEKFFKTEIISGPTSYPEKPVKQPVKNNDDFHLTPAELENIDKQKNVREAQEETKENSVIEAGETKIVGMETKIETLKAEPAVEEIKERVKKEKEEQGTQVENAKNELVNLAESITVAREKKETETETSLYNQAKEVFEVATGENLEKISKEKAKTEAEKEGLKVSTPEEYRKQKTTEIQERIQQKERSAIIKERWDMLSDKEKEKYFFGAENKNDPAVIISARIKFATELKGKIDAKRQELSKGKKGISIS